MRPEGDEWYIGVELGNQYTLISRYHRNLPEPETISTIMGTELYQIPTAICKRKATGKWCFGEEASRVAEEGEGAYVDYLLEKALRGETVLLDREYQAGDLLLVFLRKVFRMALPPQGAEAVEKCVFSMEEVGS